MRITNVFQSLLLAIAVLSTAAARSAKYIQNTGASSETAPEEVPPQRLRQINLNVVTIPPSGKPRRRTYVRRMQDRHSKATSEYATASMSMSDDDGYGTADAGPTPSPVVFEETPAPVVEEISEETGETKDNYGPIDISVDVGGDNNVVTASIQISQGGGSINVDSEDSEEESDDNGYDETLDDDEPIAIDDLTDDYPVDDGWDDYDDAYGSSVSMSMTTDDSIDDGYGSVTTIDDGYSSTTNEDDGYSATVEVETEVVGDDNWGGDDKYAALAGDTAGVETDSTDDGIIDDNEYFDDDFVVDLPSDEDLKIV